MGVLDRALGRALPISPLLPIALFFLPAPSESLLSLVLWYWCCADVALVAWLWCSGTRRPPAHRACVAHRCGAGEFPENTLAAAKLASGAAGGGGSGGGGGDGPECEWLQLDALLTRDGRVVCLHDEPVEANLTKLTGAPSGTTVKDMDFAALPPLLPELPPFPLLDAGAKPIRTAPFGPDGCRLAALEEVLTAVTAKGGETEGGKAGKGKGKRGGRGASRPTRVLLELWDSDPLLAQGVAAAVAKVGMKPGCVVVGNPFDARIAEQCAAAAPRLPRILTAKELALVFGAYWLGLLPLLVPLAEATGLLPRLDADTVVFNVPVVTKRWPGLLAAAIAKKKQLRRAKAEAEAEAKPKAAAVSQVQAPPGAAPVPPLLRVVLAVLGIFLFQPLVFQYLRSRRVVSIAWVLQDEAEWGAGMQLGADCIMTDYPTRFCRWRDSQHKRDK